MLYVNYVSKNKGKNYLHSNSSWSVVSIMREFVRNTKSQAPPQTCLAHSFSRVQLFVTL